MRRDYEAARTLFLAAYTALCARESTAEISPGCEVAVERQGGGANEQEFPSKEWPNASFRLGVVADVDGGSYSVLFTMRGAGSGEDEDEEDGVVSSRLRRVCTRTAPFGAVQHRDDSHAPIDFFDVIGEGEGEEDGTIKGKERGKEQENGEENGKPAARGSQQERDESQDVSPIRLGVSLLNLAAECSIKAAAAAARASSGGGGGARAAAAAAASRATPTTTPAPQTEDSRRAAAAACLRSLGLAIAVATSSSQCLAACGGEAVRRGETGRGCSRGD